MKKNKLILLSGTPASGKDSLTQLLINKNAHFCHFIKHKIGIKSKKVGSYYLVDPKEFSMMIELGDFFQHHSRYGRRYGVSYSELRQNWDDKKIPIIHVGRHEDMAPFLEDGEIDVYSILLLTSLEETRRRLESRHANDVDEVGRRLQAYAEERLEISQRISSGLELSYSYMMDNTKLSLPSQVELILKAVNEWIYL